MEANKKVAVKFFYTVNKQKAFLSIICEYWGYFRASTILAPLKNIISHSVTSCQSLNELNHEKRWALLKIKEFAGKRSLSRPTTSCFVNFLLSLWFTRGQNAEKLFIWERLPLCKCDIQITSPVFIINSHWAYQTCEPLQQWEFIVNDDNDLVYNCKKAFLYVAELESSSFYDYKVLKYSSSTRYKNLLVFFSRCFKKCHQNLSIFSEIPNNFRIVRVTKHSHVSKKRFKLLLQKICFQ